LRLSDGVSMSASVVCASRRARSEPDACGCLLICGEDTRRRCADRMETPYGSPGHMLAGLTKAPDGAREQAAEKVVL